jgi:hypothetical protein
MRNYAILAMLLYVTAACSSPSSETPRNSAGNSSKSLQLEPSNSLSSPDPAVQANGSETGIDPDANANANVSTLSAREEARRRKLSAAANNPAATQTIPLQYRDGPENSQIATTMNAFGQAVEIRVFKSHPELARVEADWLDEKFKILKFTFRDGRSAEVKTDKIADLATASTRTLMDVARQAK